MLNVNLRRYHHLVMFDAVLLNHIQAGLACSLWYTRFTNHKSVNAEVITLMHWPLLLLHVLALAKIINPWCTCKARVTAVFIIMCLTVCVFVFLSVCFPYSSTTSYKGFSGQLDHRHYTHSGCETLPVTKKLMMPSLQR